MSDATQDPTRPHVTWYTPDPQAARIAELERAMRHIRTLAHDADALAVEPMALLETIALLACDALAGAEPEPGAVTEEAMAI